MKLAAVAFAVGCTFSEPDYRDPSVGSLGVATVLRCQSIQGRYDPCGWVYFFPSIDAELCIIWDDRSLVLGYGKSLLLAARSLYGDCEKATDVRFAGVPVCKYQCPGATGCNATGGCFCLDEH